MAHVRRIDSIVTACMCRCVLWSVPHIYEERVNIFSTSNVHSSARKESTTEAYMWLKSQQYFSPFPHILTPIHISNSHTYMHVEMIDSKVYFGETHIHIDIWWVFLIHVSGKIEIFGMYLLFIEGKLFESYTPWPYIFAKHIRCYSRRTMTWNPWTVFALIRLFMWRDKYDKIGW